MIVFYYVGMVNKDFEYILYEFLNFDSTLWFIICIIVFGMGINILDIEVVVYWGVCDLMMDYW